MSARWNTASARSKSPSRRFPPRLEELECRNLMSAAAPVGFDQLQVSENHNNEYVLVRWESNAPSNSPTTLDLGGGLYRVTLNPGQSVAQAVSYYQGLPGVEYATPDYRVSLQRTPNDQYFGYLYGMNNTGNNIGHNPGVVDADIDAVEAWDTFTGSGNMVVAVIDTGVDYNHPDLAANMWRNTDEIAGNGIDDDGNGFRDDIYGWDFANNDNNPMDDEGHGTHVAGTIAAVGNNGIGVSGVIWSAKIMALKFLDASGNGNLSNAILALNYAVANGAKISNNSYGGGGFIQAFQTALQNARAAGHIFVAAAGNESNNNDARPSYPANYSVDNVVSVAATDNRDVLANFSNYGANTVDIAAPGVDIVSTVPGGYAYLSGTSMASPMVAGAMALVWDANPSLTYSQVISQVYSSADTITGLNGLVAGSRRLNVGRAIGTPTPPTDTTAPTVAALAFNGTTSITSVTITFSEAITAGSFTAADIVFTAPNGAAIPITGVSGSGTTFTVSFATQSAAGTYRMVVGPNITDLAGNAMTASFTATRAIAAPPTVTTFTVNPNLAIRDNATVTSSMNVTQALTISDLNVRVSLNHTYDSDLVLTLIAPSGTRILLSNRRGGSGDNFTGTTFDDEATTSITAGAAPFSGTYRPEAALSALDGRSTVGTWRLEVRDAAGGDVGTLQSWSLVVTSGGGGTSSLSVGGMRMLFPTVANEVSSTGAAVAELDFGPKDSPFETSFAPVSVVDQPTAVPVAGVSSMPSLTWLTSASVAGSGSVSVTEETVEVALDASEEEGIFVLSASEEEDESDEMEMDTVAEAVASDDLMMDLMGVELV